MDVLSESRLVLKASSYLSLLKERNVELFRQYKYRLVGEEVVLPRLFSDLFRRRRSEHVFLARHSEGRGLQGRHPDPRGFAQVPNVDHIRTAMDQAGMHDATIQRIAASGQPRQRSDHRELPLSVRWTGARPGPQPGGERANANYHDSAFTIQQVDIVGPTAGKQLSTRRGWRRFIRWSGMLVYLWFRFELIYGVAAVVAVFHDTLITVGAFILTNQEISLTVIAAILTLIGYSMNDTIVVFDRIRENLATNRRESLSDVVNRRINQTLSRTVITSGLTFLTVLSLYIFGGEVLHGFSFALVIGILIGTYSSIAVAAPMLVAYQDWRATQNVKAAKLPAKGAAEGRSTTQSASWFAPGMREQEWGHGGRRGLRRSSAFWEMFMGGHLRRFLWDQRDSAGRK